MVSSLAEQLAKSASLNANLLNDKSRRLAASESYLFSPKEARQHDLDSLHALGVNAFLQLQSLEPRLALFEHTFFSDSAKTLDRTLQPASQNAQLDAAIATFLPLLGPFLLDAPTGKVLEWMVRRFRIHEFNVASIVALFLPYHETPHFTKMVSILHIPDAHPLRFLRAYKTTAKPLHRSLLVRELLTKPDVARFVLSVFPEVLKNRSASVHRALIAFHTGVVLEYVARSKVLDENIMTVLLPAALEPLQSASNADNTVKPALLHELILGSYLILAAISQKIHLKSKAVKSLLTEIVGCADRVSSKQLVRTFVSVCAPQDQLEKLSGSLVKTLLAIPGIEAELVDAMAWIGAENFIIPLINSLLPRLEDSTAADIVESILTSPRLLPVIGISVTSTLIRRLSGNASLESLPRACRSQLSQLHQRHPKIVQEASQALIQQDGSNRDAIEQLILSLSIPAPGVSVATAEMGTVLVGTTDANTEMETLLVGTTDANAEMETLLVGTTDADASIRAKAVRDLVARLSSDPVLETEIPSLLPNFARPSGVSLEWLLQYPSDQTDRTTSHNMRAARYIQLLRAIYRLSNTSPSLPLLSTHLLRILFIDLGDDVLAFLAGVWLTAHEIEESSVHVQYAALRHACAFLEAHVAAKCSIDFQTVLPAMLVMLQSPDATVRDATLRCIAVVTKLSFEADAQAVYAFDTIYGPGSARLQYLDRTDFRKYLKIIGENRDNLAHDPEYVQKLHREHLAQVNGESKKLAGYKQRVLCYLLSHVNGCPLLNVKCALLKAVDTVSNEAKAQVLLPTIEALLNTQTVPSQQLRMLVALAVSGFDSSSAADLNDVDKSTWSMYEKVLVTCLKDERWALARDTMLHRLQHGLFAKLHVDRKSQLCRILLQAGAEHEHSSMICKRTLAHVLDDISLIARLLVSLQPQPNPDATAPPASKRARVEKTARTIISQELSPLAALAEVIGSQKIVGSLELVSSLLDTLQKVMSNVSPDAADRRFVEQILMSALENVVENFSPSTAIPRGAIRIDALVEILRTSANPQTFHQACLLMASLARVAPDAVLHNVMPIFTFMGSNVFHRDDTYSFRVVQKTIDSIVPVMVSSLKEAHGSGMTLYDASREFLRVFVNAANHIPRHRRVNFFSHLVDTLDPADFLAPVTMLLVDRRSTRVVRQNASESAASLFLPLAVFDRYSADLQLSSCLELVREVQRLANNNPTVHPFLEDTADDDEQVHADLAAKRRATALLVFCDHALKRLQASSLARSDNERAISQELLVSLLAVSTEKRNDPSYVEVAAAARTGMVSTLGVMSASDFVAGVLTMLESGSVHAQGGALELLAERLTQVSGKARRTVSPSIVKIVDKIRALLASAQEDTLVRSALQSLAAMSNTIVPGEESAITIVTPAVLGYVLEQASRVTALQTLLAFSSKLGPRTIPYLKEIVSTSIVCCRDALGDGTADPMVVPTVSTALRNLLMSTPTFWGETEVLSIIELYLNAPQASATDAAELSLLIRTVAKRASPNVLLPALCNMWTRSLAENAKGQPSKMIAFIQVVKMSVKAASRPAVLENLRDVFKTFLSMFDVCASVKNVEVESSLTSAFIELIVKLNETAFRPIFRKMFDWAFGNESEDRKVVFCHVYSSLLDFFKALMVPYMAFTWQALLEQLRKHIPSAEEGQLWLTVLRTLAKSVSADEDRVFWRSEKLRQIIPLAVQQVPVAIRLNVPQGKAAVSESLISILAILDDDVMIKTLNIDVLMHSRSEDARVRLFSLFCAEQLWRAHGDKMLGFVAETATFIAEAAEDDNDLVVREAHKLKAAVEAVGGNIDVA